MKRTVAVLVLLAVGASAQASFVWSIHPPTGYDSDPIIMNANLGIPSDATIEDFEDMDLAPGLGVSVVGHSSFTIVSPGANQVWDGDSVLHNVAELGGDGQDVTFWFNQPGVPYFGVGFSHMDYSTPVYVNGDYLFTISSATGADMGPGKRNGYLWIEGTDGDMIESVKFDALLDTIHSDTIYFDHVAFPEPGTSVLFLVGGLVAAMRRRS